MTIVGHLLDSAAGWEQRVGLTQLIDRLPGDRYGHHVATVAGISCAMRRSLDRPIHCIPRIAGINALSAPSVARFVRRHGVAVVHAWGPDAAIAAQAAVGKGVPVILQLYDPVLASRSVKRIRVLTGRGGFAVCCACEIVRRRLIEGGVDPETTVVIRPGVDFARINQLRRPENRSALGLKREDYVVVLPEPVTHSSGHEDVVIAAALLNDGRGDIRVIIPGDSREALRIRRIAQRIPLPRTVVGTPDSTTLERLICVADAMVIAARGDVSTTAIAWAMAAGVAIIGGATYCVAELIANKVNGLLFKQTPGKPMTVAIARLLKDRETQRRLTEAANGQAYEVFGLRRFTEQHMQLYENMLSGSTPAQGIADSAFAA